MHLVLNVFMQAFDIIITCHSLHTKTYFKMQVYLPKGLQLINFAKWNIPGSFFSIAGTSRRYSSSRVAKRAWNTHLVPALLLSGVAWLYQYNGCLNWQWATHTVAPILVQRPWWIWVNVASYSDIDLNQHWLKNVCSYLLQSGAWLDMCVCVCVHIYVHSPF